MLVFGSLNIDHVYQLDHLVREGETQSSTRYDKNAGGKGFNQAVALAKAGMPTAFAGAIGPDGLFLREYLEGLHVDTSRIRVLNEPTGHAMIQVDQKAQNAIILYGGANRKVTVDMAREVLSGFDAVLLQNEISCVPQIIRMAHERGMQVILNPSPASPEMANWPLELVDWLILNEVEGFDLTGETQPDAILDALLARCPDCRVVLTLGADGAVYADASRRARQPAFPAEARDTTAAGDTFTGYFLQAALTGETVETALRKAALAASITVSRPGAGESIPTAEEIQ